MCFLLIFICFLIVTWLLYVSYKMMSKTFNCEVDKDEIICTPPELKNVANIAMESVLPKKSKSRYEMAYNIFIKWQQKHNIGNLFSENVLLAYFSDELKSKQPSTLWSLYSMLRTMINLKNKVDISKYSNLLALLKNKNKGFKPKQAKVFTDDEVQRFIQTAPDDKYLATKVILLFGMLGACRSDELIRMTVDDVKRFDSPEQMYLVSIPEENKTNVNRSFTISEASYFNVVEKYINLRPNDMPSKRFFITYHDGKCMKLNMGKNKISHAAKEIAKFLKLDPDLFTGHSFRRSSTTTLANAGADLLQIKRFGGWKSNAVAERYIDDSVYQKKKTETMITSSLSASTASTSGEKFVYKTPKVCTLPSFSFSSPSSTKKETSTIKLQMMSEGGDGEQEQEVRLSQYIIEDYVVSEEILSHSKDENGSNNLQLSNSNPNFVFNNCNVTFHVGNG